MIKLDILYRLQTFQQKLLQEQERWILWLPVLMGIGIVGYFQLTFEPWIGIGSVFCAILGIFLWRTRNRSYFWTSLIFKILLLVSIGFSAAQIKTWRMSTSMLYQSYPSMEIEGTLIKIEKMSGRVRLTLEQVKCEDKNLSQSLNLVRISCRGVGAKAADSWVPGQRVSLRAKLLPPNEPIAPSTYDFRRKSYFEGISAVGYGTTTPKVISKPEIGSSYKFDLEMSHKLAQIRHYITEQLRQKIGGSEGAICIVPGCNGVSYGHLLSSEELWDKYYMDAPKRHRQCVGQYKIVKRV